MTVRLPSLYPMPRDIEQYTECVDALGEGLTPDQYRTVLRQRLRREDDTPYSESMIQKLVSNLTATGFVCRSTTDSLTPPPGQGRTAEAARSGDLFRAALSLWGTASHPNQRELRLVLDLLESLRESAGTEAELVQRLTADSDDGGKYDPHDKFAFRTIREVLKLLRFAGYVENNEGVFRATSLGLKARTKLQRGDILRVAGDLIQKLGPDTHALSDSVKIATAKYYMYLECGGKGKDSQFVNRIFRGLRDPRSPGSLRANPLVSRAIRHARRARRQLISQITSIDPEIGRQSALVRSLAKLTVIHDALRRGDIYEANRALSQGGTPFSWDSIRRLQTPGPDYSVRDGFQPHKWQKAALATWVDRGCRGIAQVVTGAGKTVFAMQAIEHAWHQTAGRIRITVLVPTKVLMYQWATELVRVLGVPISDIGLRGDGHKDTFSDGKKLVVSIVNSAILQRRLKRDVDTVDAGISHFLIADECHRYRGDQFQKCLDCRFELCLGLSATPDAPESGVDGPAEGPDVVLDRLGGTIFNYSYKEALADSIIQPFVVKYVGVELLEGERQVYELLSKRISKAIERLLARYGSRLESGGTRSLDRRLQTILKTDPAPDPAIHDYFRLVRERKALVFGAVNRKRCYLDIMSNHASRDRVIVFHERIEDLDDIVAPLERREYLEDRDNKVVKDPAEHEANKHLEQLFLKPSFRAVMYHSGHPRPLWNEISMEWFRSGVATIMLSVKALIEGVDVPEANLGIVRTSSSSVRQRIQTTGRVLRRSSAKERASELYVLYVRESSDERIFADVNWNKELGSASIESWHWAAPKLPAATSGGWINVHGKLPEIRTRTRPSETDVDEASLVEGGRYPGPYIGQEFHVDSSGRPFQQTGRGRRYIAGEALQRVGREIQRLKGGGKFVITSRGFVISRVRGVGLVYLGRTGVIRFESESVATAAGRTRVRDPALAKLLSGT